MTGQVYSASAKLCWSSVLAEALDPFASFELADACGGGLGCSKPNLARFLPQREPSCAELIFAFLSFLLETG